MTFKMLQLDPIVEAKARVLLARFPSVVFMISPRVAGGGLAFDVQPDSCPFTALEDLHPDLLLTVEDPLKRWHAQWKQYARNR